MADGPRRSGGGRSSEVRTQGGQAGAQACRPDLAPAKFLRIALYHPVHKKTTASLSVHRALAPEKGGGKHHPNKAQSAAGVCRPRVYTDQNISVDSQLNPPRLCSSSKFNVLFHVVPCHR